MLALDAHILEVFDAVPAGDALNKSDVYAVIKEKYDADPSAFKSEPKERMVQDTLQNMFKAGKIDRAKPGVYAPKGAGASVKESGDSGDAGVNSLLKDLKDEADAEKKSRDELATQDAAKPADALLPKSMRAESGGDTNNNVNDNGNALLGFTPKQSVGDLLDKVEKSGATTAEMEQKEAERKASRGPLETADQKLKAEIAERFEILEEFTQAVAYGTLRGMIVTGAPGIGKTYGIKKVLDEHNTFQAIADGSPYKVIKGKITAAAFYVQLFLNNQKNQIIWFDDSDGLFNDTEGLNLLKAATELEGERKMSYNSMNMEAGYFRKHEIPSEFVYEGSIIAISNMDFSQVGKRRNKSDDHLEAVMDRCVFLDMGCHDAVEKIARIEQVVDDAGLLGNRGMDEAQQKLVMDFVWKHQEKLGRKLSLRTVIRVAKIFQMYHTHMAPGQINPRWEIAALFTANRG